MTETKNEMAKMGSSVAGLLIVGRSREEMHTKKREKDGPQLPDLQ